LVQSIGSKVTKDTTVGRTLPVLSESLGLGAREVVSLAGAGGKTTLLFRLANELFLSGKRVVTTTTTRILEPTSTETACFFVHSSGEKIKEFLKDHLDQVRHITVAGERLGAGKVKGVSPDLIIDLWRSSMCDYIIVEADGAAGRPVKAPREQEPVIPSNTTIVVAILGVDGVGAELDEKNVFQPALISRLTGVPLGQRIDAESMATLMTHPEGIFKGAPASSRVVAFLNKVDLASGLDKAEEVAKRILEKKHPRVERVVLGQLRCDPPVAKVYFSHLPKFCAM
jgi:probable selenium-dependent hydroxylase accessory protein YqeC